MSFDGIFDRTAILLFVGGILSFLYGIFHSLFYNLTVNNFMLNGGILGILLIFASMVCIDVYLDGKEIREKNEMKSRINELEEKVNE